MEQGHGRIHHTDAGAAAALSPQLARRNGTGMAPSGHSRHAPAARQRPTRERKDLHMAERGGFEPPNELAPVNGFRDRLPLIAIPSLKPDCRQQLALFAGIYEPFRFRLTRPVSSWFGQFADSMVNSWSTTQPPEASSGRTDHAVCPWRTIRLVVASYTERGRLHLVLTQAVQCRWTRVEVGRM